jgi:prepilin-type N-terminal cleavage/methylation domain-containing protein
MFIRLSSDMTEKELATKRRSDEATQGTFAFVVADSSGFSATKRQGDEVTKGTSAGLVFPLRRSVASSLRRLFPNPRFVAPSLVQAFPTPEGWCHISDDLVAFPAPDALIGGDDPAGGHPLGGREQSAVCSGEGPKKRPSAHCPPPTARSGFTLIEILIVIGIIVLLIAIAIPAFNAISGSRSIDAAANTISAFVGRARLEAIGLQETRGVMFFLDPVSQETKVAIVRDTHELSSDEAYLDLASDSDFLTIPSGVGIQFVDDCTFNNARQRLDDGFLGFFGFDPGNSSTPHYYERPAASATLVNTPNKALAANLGIGGVILFDAQGRLVCKQFVFKTRKPDTGSPTNYSLTSLGRRLFTVNNTQAEEIARRADVTAIANIVPWQRIPNPGRQCRTQVGFVLFDKAAFASKAPEFTVTDPQMSSTAYDTGESNEETWLDENATVYLVNRYNGTLVKGE